MTDYNLITDFLATFRALPDIIKTIWLVFPPTVLLAVLVFWLKYSRSRMPEEQILEALTRIDIRPVHPTHIPLLCDRPGVQVESKLDINR